MTLELSDGPPTLTESVGVLLVLVASSLGRRHEVNDHANKRGGGYRYQRTRALSEETGDLIGLHVGPVDTGSSNYPINASPVLRGTNRGRKIQ